jgi:hypothetical protein
MVHSDVDKTKNDFHLVSAESLFLKKKDNKIFFNLYGLDDKSIAFADRPSRSTTTKNSLEFFSSLSKKELNDRDLVLSFYDTKAKRHKTLALELKNIINFLPGTDELGFQVNENLSQQEANLFSNDEYIDSQLFGKNVTLFLDQAKSDEHEHGQETSQLLIGGFFEKFRPSKDGRSKLFLNNVSEESLFFTNHPFVNAGYHSTSEVVDNWSSIFKGSNPNVGFNIVNNRTGEHHNNVFTMSNPRYNSKKKTLNFDAKFESNQKGDSQPYREFINYLLEDEITGLKYNFTSNLFIDGGSDLDGFCPDFVGNSAFKVTNNTNRNLKIQWSNYGNDNGYSPEINDKITFPLEVGKTSKYIYGENCDKWDVSMKVTNIWGNKETYMGQFDAQRPNIGKAWLSNDKENSKIYATSNDFNYKNKIINGKISYPWSVHYTSEYVQNDPVSGDWIDSTLNIWHLTFHPQIPSI